MKEELQGLMWRVAGIIAIAAAVVSFPLAAHVGEFLTPTNTAQSWNPLTLATGLLNATSQWPSSSTAVLVVCLVLVAGLYFGAIFGTGGNSGHGELAKRLATGSQLAPLKARKRGKEAAQLHPNAVDLVPGQRVGTTAAGRNSVLYQGWRDLGACCMGPGSGKTSCFVIPRMAAAPGPALMTSNKVDGVAEVIAARYPLGTIWLFDPNKIYRQSDRPDFTFNPLSEIHGTEDAVRLASWIITASSKNNSTTGEQAKEDAQFGPSGESCVAWALLAASLTGKTLADVHGWIAKGAYEAIKNILSDHGYERPAVEMGGFDKWPDRTRGSLVATTQRMCRDLVHEAILAWTTPTAGIRHFDPAAFIEGRQTMILLSERGPGGAGAVITAMIKAICNAAIKKTPGQARLTVPLVGELDEVANIVPWPTLPQDFSHFGSRGLCFTVYLQGWSQGCGEWGVKGMETLWQMAGIRVIGSNDEPAWLEGISKLIGTYQRPVPGSDIKERLPKASVEDLGNLPKFTAVLTTSVTPAALITLTPWHKIRELKKRINNGMDAADKLAQGVELKPTSLPVQPAVIVAEPIKDSEAA